MKKTGADILAALIDEALRAGYDIDVKFLLRTDGKEGEIRLPTLWLEHIAKETGTDISKWR